MLSAKKDHCLILLLYYYSVLKTENKSENILGCQLFTLNFCILFDIWAVKVCYIVKNEINNFNKVKEYVYMLPRTF